MPRGPRLLDAHNGHPAGLLARLRRHPRVHGKDLRLNFNQRRYATNQRAFRSGLEEKAEAQLKAAGHPVYYELVQIPFVQPAKPRHYKPDFVLRNGVIVETKGLFQTEDKQKHLMVKAQHPDLDIRFVFSNAQAKVSKLSATTYAMWAAKHGFQWAHRVIPQEWLDEDPNDASLAALRELGFTPQ